MAKAAKRTEAKSDTQSYGYVGYSLGAKAADPAWKSISVPISCEAYVNAT